MGDTREELRVVFRGLEFRIVHRCFPAQLRLSVTTSVRDGDDWQEIYGHSVREMEDKWRAGFDAALAHAYTHGKE